MDTDEHRLPEERRDNLCSEAERSTIESESDQLPTLDTVEHGWPYRGGVGAEGEKEGAAQDQTGSVVDFPFEDAAGVAVLELDLDAEGIGGDLVECDGVVGVLGDVESLGIGDRGPGAVGAVEELP